MGLFYGNAVNHLNRTNFSFYKRYPNRDAMQTEVEVLAEDEKDDVIVPPDVYLLVDYNLDGTEYINNLARDEEIYGSGSFDLTVWQVQLIDELAKCVAIARLHSVIPTFETYGSYRIDILDSMGGPDYFGKGKNQWNLNYENLFDDNGYMTSIIPAPVEEPEE